MNKYLRPARWTLLLLTLVSFTSIAKTLVLRNGAEPGTLNPFNAETTSESALIYNIYAFNLKDPKYHNKYLRQALAMAIDRDTITRSITRQGEKPAYNAVPPNSNDYVTPEFSPINMDQKARNQKARELLKKANIGNPSDFEVEVLYNTREPHRQIALAISDMWKRNLGIKTRLRNMEFNSMLADVAQGKYELSRKTWVVGDPEPCYMLKIFQSDDPFNDTKYDNPKLDTLLGRACTDKLTPEHKKFRQQRNPAV